MTGASARGTEVAPRDSAVRTGVGRVGVGGAGAARATDGRASVAAVRSGADAAPMSEVLLRGSDFGTSTARSRDVVGSRTCDGEAPPARSATFDGAAPSPPAAVGTASALSAKRGAESASGASSTRTPVRGSSTIAPVRGSSARATASPGFSVTRQSRVADVAAMTAAATSSPSVRCGVWLERAPPRDGRVPASTHTSDPKASSSSASERSTASMGPNAGNARDTGAAPGSGCPAESGRPAGPRGTERGAGGCAGGDRRDGEMDRNDSAVPWRSSGMNSTVERSSALGGHVKSDGADADASASSHSLRSRSEEDSRRVEMSNATFPLHLRIRPSPASLKLIGSGQRSRFTPDLPRAD